MARPLLLQRIARVRELSLRCRHERPGVERVEQFLLVQRDTRDIDGLEPLFDLGLGSLTYVHGELVLQDRLLVLHGERGERLLRAVQLDRELALYEAADARNPLLAIENLKVCPRIVEIDQP